jgi:hypothetical protein
MYENCKIYGPYKRNDNRQHVIIIFPDKTRTTVSYPKYLMECYLNRHLDVDLETIDHLDGNPLNSVLSNLQIVPRVKHCMLDVQRNKEQEFTCAMCGTIFPLSGKRLHDAFRNRKKGSPGPFCGKSCASKATHLSSDDFRLEIKEVIKERHTLKNPEIVLSIISSTDK